MGVQEPTFVAFDGFFGVLTPSTLRGCNFLNSILFLMIFNVPIGGVHHISHLPWDSGLVAFSFSSSLLFSQVLNSVAIWIPLGWCQVATDTMWKFWKTRRGVCHNDNMCQLELCQVVDNKCAKVDKFATIEFKMPFCLHPFLLFAAKLLNS